MADYPPQLQVVGPLQGSELLQKERQSATFSVRELSVFLYGAKQLERQEKVLGVIENDPVMRNSDRYYLGRTQRMARAMEKDKRLLELVKKHHWSDLEHYTADLLIDESRPFVLHYAMFIPTLIGQASEKQKEMFLKPALRHEIIGCYAQTELGHGSNVQGLETTATYIPEAEQFEIHSPHLTSSKWWIGGLGLAATHAIVMARLITGGKDYGPHPFVVPIRSLEDHRPLPGITVGDIGPKFGVNTIDNGFVLFDHVRIPRDHMLSRYATVTKEGKYVPPPNPKLAYGTMVFVRTLIVERSAQMLSRAVTVSIRYSAVRRQFNEPSAASADSQDPSGENQVLNYTTLQYRLFPALAQTFALHYTGQRMRQQYNQLVVELNRGNLASLGEIHATSSGLKSLCSTMAIEGIECCRHACGGHGFSSFSGLTEFYTNCLPNVTWEGDNYILTQQTARFLLKTFGKLVQPGGKQDSSVVELNPTSEYLTTYLKTREEKPVQRLSHKMLLDPDFQIRVFCHRAGSLVEETARALTAGKTWNDVLIDVARVSRAHCEYILVWNQWATLRNPEFTSKHPGLKNVLYSLANLFSIYTMEQSLDDLLEDGYFIPEYASVVREVLQGLLSEIRPNAVALVDAFAIPDYVLNSALGRYDGKVYEALFQGAWDEPLNIVSRNEPFGFKEYMKPARSLGTTVDFKARL